MISFLFFEIIPNVVSPTLFTKYNDFHLVPILWPKIILPYLIFSLPKKKRYITELILIYDRILKVIGIYYVFSNSLCL